MPVEKIVRHVCCLLGAISFVACMDSPVHASDKLTIMFLGDSLTAGYGIEQEMAFPALVAEKARAAGYEIEIINAGMSGDTSAGGVRRLPWLLRRKIDIAVVALGANDGLRGLPVANLKDNLSAAVGQIRSKYPNAEILSAGMKLPTNFGGAYRESFEAAFDEVAREHNTGLIPFLLEGVAADAALNLPDRLHPSASGHEVIADTVWRALGPVLARAAHIK